MAQIERINVQMRTVDRNRAGTDGDVYFGICGREFYLDTSRDDFERASDFTYILGENGNLNNNRDNNPRRPQLFTENLVRFPIYIRFSPESRTDNWNLESALVTVNPDSEQQVQYQVLGGGDNLWLGVHSGLFVYLFLVVIS